jgi:hypothetical protein
MIILEYLKNLLNLMQDESIPVIGKLAVGNFILCVLLLLSFINVLIYFLVLITFDNILVQNLMNKYSIIKRILILYKNTRIYFLIFEILFFISINLFILWNCYRLFSFYIN